MDSAAAGSGSTLAVTNCTFRDNEASETGSAIFIADAALRSEGCTFLGNSPPDVSAQVRTALRRARCAYAMFAGSMLVGGTCSGCVYRKCSLQLCWRGSNVV